MKNLVQLLVLCFAFASMALVSMAQDASTEPRVIRGSKVVLIFKNSKEGRNKFRPSSRKGCNLKG